MPQTVPSEGLAATAVELMPAPGLATQVHNLSVDVECLDKAVIENGLVASRALALAEGLKTTLEVALCEVGADDETAASFGARSW